MVITFLPRSKRLLISWLQSPSAVILDPQKIKSDTVSPSISHEVMGPDAMLVLSMCLIGQHHPFITLFSFPILYGQKAMAPHSSTLAWKIPWTEEPGRLQSLGSLGVGHDLATSLLLLDRKSVV